MAKLLLLLFSGCIFGGVDAFGSVPDINTKSAEEQLRSTCQDIFFDQKLQRTNPLNTFQQTPQTGVCLDVEQNFRNFDVRAGVVTERMWCGDVAAADCEKAYVTRGNGDFSPCTINDDTKSCVVDQSERLPCNWASPDTCEAIYSGTVQAAVTQNQNFNDVCLSITTKEQCTGYVFPVLEAGASFDESTQNRFYSCGWGWKQGVQACTTGGPIDCKPRADLFIRRRVQDNADVCGQFDKDQCDLFYTYVGGDDRFLEDPDNFSPPPLALCKWDGESGACIESTDSEDICPYACEVMGINRGAAVPGRVASDESLTFNDNVLDNQDACFKDWAHTQSKDACEEHFTTFLRSQAAIDQDVADGKVGYKFQPIACLYTEASFGGVCNFDTRADWGGVCE